MEVQRNLANAQFYLAAGLANLGRYDDMKRRAANFSMVVMGSELEKR